MANRLCLLASLAIVGAVALQIPVDCARSAEPSPQEAAAPAPSRQTPATLNTIIIQARRDGEIKRQIAEFVSGGVATYFDESLERWNQPVCPLVAGLPDKPAEFIRARVSQVARDSHAPLGFQHCKPNLVVVITNDPDLLLKKWYRRVPALFDTCNGFGPVKRFLHSRQPIRVFYNATFTAAGGGGIGARVLMNLPPADDCLGLGSVSTYLHYGVVHELTSVIIVVDARRTATMKLGQLADYIAMIGLAQVRVRSDTGTAPSILRLFQRSDPKPLGLSTWDEAFLRSLYTTDQSSTVELPIIENRMFEQIVGRQPR